MSYLQFQLFPNQASAGGKKKERRSQSMFSSGKGLRPLLYNEGM